MFASESHTTGSTTYQIDNSLRFDGSNDYLSRTPSASNRKTWTWSGWYKRGKLGVNTSLFSAGDGAVNYCYIFIGTDDKFNLQGIQASANSFSRISNAVFRDTSAHYHVVVQFDATNTSVKLYINGVEQTCTGTQPANTDYPVNSSSYVHRMGVGVDGSSYPVDGYLSDVYFIDGYKTGTTMATATDFGETNADGVWVPRAYTGTYGTNGFHLDFADGTSTTTLGYDAAGSNDWTLTGMTRAAGVNECWMQDTPTNNFATLNPLNGDATLSNANLKAAGGGGAVAYGREGTIGVQGSGKYYWEYTVATVDTGAQYHMPGLCDATFDPADYNAQPTHWSYVSKAGTGTLSAGGNGAQAGTWACTNIAVGVTIGIAYDAATGKMFASTNGTFVNSGDPAAGTGYTHLVTLTGPLFPLMCYVYTNSGDINFGQRAFTYTPPTGFLALSTANLPAVAITNPREHFGIRLYSGTAESQSFTTDNNSVALPQADFGWIKHRGAAAGQDHQLFDILRSENLPLISNSTAAEGSAVTGFSLDAAGFTVPANTSKVSTTGETYAAWLWKANGAGVSNTAGSITSTVSANTTAGFSIVAYTGNGSTGTVGHGLGVVPKLIIVKERGAAGNSWPVWHSAACSGTEYLYLNGTSAKATSVNFWNSTVPTSSVFSVGNDSATNGATTKIAYCFAEIPGYSKFGSYTGNGSADGPFVHCGFRPRWVMVKCSSASTTLWWVVDTARDIYNAFDKAVYPHAADAETTGWTSDALSNGFKIRGSGSHVNSSGATYIFAAFAEFPSGGSNCSPSPAR